MGGDGRKRREARPRQDTPFGGRLAQSTPCVKAPAHRPNHRDALPVPPSSPPPSRARRGLQTALAIVEDQIFDRRRGLETRRVVPSAALTDALGPHADQGYDYHPTRARAFRRLLRALALPPGLGFLDLGCGKGRVLLLAAEQPFARVAGVEFSPSLCAVARENLHRAGASAVTLFQADAASLELPHDLHVFYFFNPFGEAVLAPVLRNIGASLAQAPRPAWLVFNKVQPTSLIPLAGPFQPHLDLVYGNAEFHVWHRPGA